MAFAVGTRLGAYEITGMLGAGGMGEVYRARDTQLGRDVAIKTLPSALAQDHDRLARFDREAKLLAGLNHAHIAVVHGLDEHEGTRYLAMELVEGETLEQELKKGALPIEDALRIALQIAEALEAAHEKGVVHRDLKPANVMITKDGAVKVLDFGLAKAFAGDPSHAVAAHSPALSAAMTQQGLILGTAGYMAPEQASGQATDQRADIWAFGVVLYEMLTGLPVFSGESVPHILADVLRTEPNWSRLPKKLHPRVRQLLERCLEKKVRDRYHSMADVRVDIEKALRDPQGGALAASEARPFWPRAAAVAAVALALGTVLASAYFLSSREGAAPIQASAAPPVSRYVITPPATAPLASQAPTDIAISPDGKRIAYLGKNLEHNTVELYVRDLDALESRLLPGTEVDWGAVIPFFSLDGRSIGFSAGARGVFGAATDGRPSVKLLDAPRPAFMGGTWADDHTLIYSSMTQLQRGTPNGAGAPETLITERKQGSYVARPVVLPGGRAVLFSDVAGGVERVAVVDLQTGEEKTLFEGGTALYAQSGHIVYGRNTTLMAVPFDVTELAVTGEPVAVLQGVRHPGPGSATDFDLAANGTLVYVPAPSDTGSGAVVWVDRAGQVVGPAVSGRVQNPRDPRLSPDGKHLLLVTGSAAAGELWSYDLDGRPPIPLSLSGDNMSPVWSPDGRQVAFARRDGGTPRIYTLPADGSVLTPQPLTTATSSPQAWSAAGELVVLLVPTPTNPDIAVMNAAGGGEPRRIVATEFIEADAALSPDGRWLAYASFRTGRFEIWAQGYPDGVAVRVSTSGGREPRWSADGRELYYLQGNAMMAVAVAAQRELSLTPPRQLFPGTQFEDVNAQVGNAGYDVAPDGRFLMIRRDSGADEAAASIVVVENWTEELKQRVRPRGQ